MRKLAVFAGTLLACCTWSCQSKIGNPGESVTIQGCLKKSGGGYTLTDDSGRVYQLTGEESALSSHTGQQTLVRGNQIQSSRTPGAPPQASSQGAPNAVVVTSVHATSGTCKAQH